MRALITSAILLTGLAAGCATSNLHVQPPGTERADGQLAGTDRLALIAGDNVAHPIEFDRGEAHYVGGVSYQVVRATPDAVLAALDDPRSLADMLPRTKHVKLVDTSAQSKRLELRQGNDIVEATYTVRVERSGDTMHFWMDESRPHDIDDVWGYFRVEPFDNERTLITVAVALNMGPGIGRLLFEGKVQDLILSTPRAMRVALERSDNDLRQARVER